MQTILVVEDEELLADFFQKFLGTRQYEIIVAHDGRQALEKLQSSRPAAILADLMLPEMDGLELCRRLAQDDRYRTIPFILMSVGQRPQELNAYPNVAFFSKPFLIPDLQALLERMMMKA